MSSRLLAEHPLQGTVETTAGPLPRPYVISDGVGAFIGGTADADAVRALLARENLHPLLNAAGRACMGLWVCDFTAASLGPHHELQVSIFVTRSPAPALRDRPLSLLAAMLGAPDVRMLCHGLWNNTPRVIAYNRERLSLDARRMTGRITRDAAQLQFDLRDESGGALASGALARPTTPMFAANLQLLSLAGFGRLMALARAPWVELKVVNPRGVRLDVNAEAVTRSRPGATVIRLFDPRIDRVSLAAPGYAGLGFVPQFFETMTGFEFVYLDPQ